MLHARTTPGRVGATMPCFTIGIALAAVLLLAAPASATDAAGCDAVASPTATIDTTTELLAALQPGQVGCYRAGTYRESTTRSVNYANVTTSGVTLQSYPDERATLEEGLVVFAAGVRIRRLNIDGTTGRAGPPTLILHGDDAKIYDNDITNRDGICVQPKEYDGSGMFAGATPDRFEIKRNRIHDCKPANNHNQGVYISYGANGVVSDNVIYNNGDRGLQFYPDGNGSTVSTNTFAGNRTNVNFGSPEGATHGSSNNTVSNSILAFPTTTSTEWPGDLYNVHAVWSGAQGSNNNVTNNCAWTSSGTSGMGSLTGLTVTGTVVANPSFRNPAYGDYSVPPGNSCAGKSAPAAVVTPSVDGLVSLTRYHKQSAGDHWVTTGTAAGYDAESTIGFIERTPDVAGTIALYSCLNGGDHFLSIESNCENQTGLGTLGWIYSSQPGSFATVPVYRCLSSAGDHFASNLSTCEGTTNEGLLGYARSSVPFNRYRRPAEGGLTQDHWVSTSLIVPPYVFEGTLGNLVTTPPSAPPTGTHAIYTCMVTSGGQNDHMLSTGSTCEGTTPLGVEGFAYDTQVAGTHPIYRCYSGGNHFVSLQANCEGTTNEGVLGYLPQ